MTSFYIVNVDFVRKGMTGEKIFYYFIRNKESPMKKLAYGLNKLFGKYNVGCPMRQHGAS